MLIQQEKLIINLEFFPTQLFMILAMEVLTHFQSLCSVSQGQPIWHHSVGMLTEELKGIQTFPLYQWPQSHNWHTFWQPKSSDIRLAGSQNFWYHFSISDNRLWLLGYNVIYEIPIDLQKPLTRLASSHLYLRSTVLVQSKDLLHPSITEMFDFTLSVVGGSLSSNSLDKFLLLY